LKPIAHIKEKFDGTFEIQDLEDHLKHTALLSVSFAAQFDNPECKIIPLNITKTSLIKLDIDEAGLDQTDYRYMNAIIDRFNGGPVGLNAIAASISEDPTTLEDVTEPYLLQEGFIVRTPRGRMVTEKAYRHLGKEK